MGQHGANVGKYMGFLPAGGVAITNAKAMYTRMYDETGFAELQR